VVVKERFGGGGVARGELVGDAFDQVGEERVVEGGAAA
jgi:hypothetical protein